MKCHNRVQRKSFLQLRQAEANIYYSPNIISTSPKNVLMSRLISKFFGNLNSSKNFTCRSGKLITEFTSPIAKSTSPALSDTTFFARCIITRALSMKYSICNIHLLPKAADLRKEAFDEFPLPLNMAIVLQLLSRNALITFLGRLPVHSSFPGSLYRVACYVLCGSTRISVIEN